MTQQSAETSTFQRMPDGSARRVKNRRHGHSRKIAVTEPSAAVTGPPAPQDHVPAPAGGLPVRAQMSPATLWVVGCHGGAGESSVAGLLEGWQETGRSWPALPSGESAPCVLVARTNVHGLRAAQDALTQWAASGAGPSVTLLGLVLIADAPGKLPAPLRDLAKVVGGGAPRVWDIPWIEEWRLGDPVATSAPRSTKKLAALLGSLAAATPVTAGNTTTKEMDE